MTFFEAGLLGWQLLQRCHPHALVLILSCELSNRAIPWFVHCLVVCCCSCCPACVTIVYIYISAALLCPISPSVSDSQLELNERLLLSSRCVQPCTPVGGEASFPSSSPQLSGFRCMLTLSNGGLGKTWTAGLSTIYCRVGCRWPLCAEGKGVTAKFTIPPVVISKAFQTGSNAVLFFVAEWFTSVTEFHLLVRFQMAGLATPTTLNNHW